MCVVSMIGDHYRDKWQIYTHPPIQPNPYTPIAKPIPSQTIVTEYATKVDLEQLRKEVLEMKELLKKAKAYDEANGEKDCEVEDKYALIRRIAELVGVDLEDVIGK